MTTSSTPSATTSSTTDHPAAPGLGRASLVAVVGAAVAVAVVHVAFDLAGADFVVAPPGQAETTVTAVLAALVAAAVTAVGCGVAALLARRAARPDRAFLVAVVVVLVVMGVNPVLAADQLLTVVALEVEHLAAAAVALAALLPPLRAARRR